MDRALRRLEALMAVADSKGTLLISGTGEAYMLALLKRHPREPLRLAREQRDGQPWFRVLYGNYPDRALAERVMGSLPSELPQRRCQVVTL